MTVFLALAQLLYQGWRWLRWWLLWIFAWFIVGVIIGFAASAEPLAARQYRNEVIREARVVWGLTAPVAIFAGQIEQESSWDAKACSPYACGLAQFTPSTAAWISGVYGELAGADVFNPSWAIRALMRYDALLYRSSESAATERDRWSFTLAAYNGGPGALHRELELCARLDHCDPAIWSDVSPLRSRSVQAHRENRGYVAAILGRRQFTYSHWGPTV